MTFKDPRFAIAVIIIGLFAWAYYSSPSQEMTGALIAAFSGAWGYFLGSSSGAAKNADNTGKALDIAVAATPAPTPPIQPVVIQQPPEQPVPVVPQPEGAN